MRTSSAALPVTENVMVRHPADLVVAVPPRVFRCPEPGLLVGNLDPDAAARGDVKYLSLPHSRAARGVRVVAEGDDLPRLEPQGFSFLHFLHPDLRAQ